ncbi:Putative RNA-binding protein YlmH [Linum grandiflorum]
MATAMLQTAAPWLLRRTIQSFHLPTVSKLSITGKLRFLPLHPPTRHQHVSGICSSAQAMKKQADGLLNSVTDKNVIEDVKYVIEMATRAARDRKILYTDFLTPPTVKESMVVLEKLADITTDVQGGYPEAERCRISIAHHEVLAQDADIVAAMSISGNFGFVSCSHGDFLGAILGTGVAREKVGDVLLLQGGKGAQFLVVPELVEFFRTSLDKVGNVPVSCTRIPLPDIEYEPPSTKTFRTVEASLRLDALASAGFKLSRSKLVDLISKGDVRVNWSTVTKNNTSLRSGDMISVSGKGRLKIGEINSTKKGKFGVELIRYL